MRWPTSRSSKYFPDTMNLQTLRKPNGKGTKNAKRIIVHFAVSPFPTLRRRVGGMPGVASWRFKEKTGTSMARSRRCAPGGIRIRVLALKGPRPGPLDDGGVKGDRVGRPYETPRLYRRYSEWSRNCESDARPRRSSRSLLHFLGVDREIPIERHIDRREDVALDVWFHQHM